jgi:hypothetical protein
MTIALCTASRLLPPPANTSSSDKRQRRKTDMDVPRHYDWNPMTIGRRPKEDRSRSDDRRNWFPGRRDVERARYKTVIDRKPDSQDVITYEERNASDGAD